MIRRRSNISFELHELHADSVDFDDIPKVDPTTVPKSLYGHGSFASLTSLSAIDKAKVLVLYTGGTIGMVKNERGKLAPSSSSLDAFIRKYPNMHDSDFNDSALSEHDVKPLVLPIINGRSRVLYWVVEYEPLLDSSDMTMDDWIRIAVDIRHYYEMFDGFVVLHGTDTLAYTASALSFMVENLGKPIIITGSQIPMFESRSDGRDNFITSLIIAGTHNIPEVAVCFNNSLYRGNRTVKVNSGSMDAFSSPNFPPIAKVGIDIEPQHRLIFRSKKLQKFRIDPHLNRNVGLIHLFPSISIESIKTVLQPPTAGVVLQTYGSGNIPSTRKDIVEALKEATDRGVLIVNITQCLYGGITTLYENGQILADAQVLPGYDMTTEAALTKLAYVLAKVVDLDEKRRLMVQCLRGEMTIPNEMEEIHPDNLITNFTDSLSLENNEIKEQMKEILVPNLFLNALYNSDIDKIKHLTPHFTEMNMLFSCGQTALHIAATEGDPDVVKWLLKNGASVHAKNSNGFTPLWSAIQRNHSKVVEFLLQTGAHLTISNTLLADCIIQSSASNDVTRLKLLEKCGANMAVCDTFKRNGLHAACTLGKLEAVKFLLKCHVSAHAPDVHGLTPIKCAQKFPEILHEFNKLL